MGNDHNTAALQCKLLLLDLLRDVRAYLVAESEYESYAEQVSADDHQCWHTHAVCPLFSKQICSSCGRHTSCAHPVPVW